MKGNATIIASLNKALAEELTAINQYMVHSEMCDNWGYGKLHEKIEKRAIEEMHHAEKLIARILFLEGQPEVGSLNKIQVGSTVEAQIKNDLGGENDAVRSYNAGIRQAAELGDNATREMLESILKDEEAHIDWLEAQLDQIAQMGVQNYLSQQVS